MPESFVSSVCSAIQQHMPARNYAVIGFSSIGHCRKARHGRLSHSAVLACRLPSLQRQQRLPPTSKQYTCPASSASASAARCVIGSTLGVRCMHAVHLSAQLSVQAHCKRRTVEVKRLHACGTVNLPSQLASSKCAISILCFAHCNLNFGSM